jgi:predicted metal-binding protein
MLDKDYVVVVRCDIVAERCSGYFCEKAFHERREGFADYDKDKPYRMLFLTCGGCCGKGVQRRLTHLARKIKKNEGMEKGRIVVQLASCITRDNFHAPPCPHLGYMKEVIARAGLDVREGTHISPKAEERRASGRYKRNS